MSSGPRLRAHKDASRRWTQGHRRYRGRLRHQECVELRAAAVAANNAAQAQRNATYAEEVGQVNATTVSLKNAATMGKIKTAQAASGVEVNAPEASEAGSGHQGHGSNPRGRPDHVASAGTAGGKLRVTNRRTRTTSPCIGRSTCRLRLGIGELMR
jgi:hypothetical protein